MAVRGHAPRTAGTARTLHPITPPANLLAQALQQFADARHWGPFHSPKNLASALTAEAGEPLEHFQWLTEDQSRQLPPAHKQAVAYEMAVVLLYLVQLATVLDVDLLQAAEDKMQLNTQKYPAPAPLTAG